MPALTLYYAPGTCAQAVRIALEEAQAPHALVRVDFASQQQRTPEYLAVNPKGRVPALVTEQGTLTETPALLVYVAQRFPAAQLAPTDAFGLARMQEFNSYLASTVHIAHAHRPRAARTLGINQTNGAGKTQAFSKTAHVQNTLDMGRI